VWLVTRLRERLHAIDRDLQDAVPRSRCLPRGAADCEDAARTGLAARRSCSGPRRRTRRRAAGPTARRASALQAVSGSFREAGYTGVADEIDATLKHGCSPRRGGQ
jgi:hypothetical protein